jgi:hypothetical protein
MDDVKTDFGQRLNLFENRMVGTLKDHIESSNNNMDNMKISLEKLMSVVNKLLLSHSGNTSQNMVKSSRDTSKNPSGSLMDNGSLNCHHSEDNEVLLG